MICLTLTTDIMKKSRGYRALLVLLLLPVTICTYAIEMKVVFKTSVGDPIESAHVKYLANNWKNFGLTYENGEVTKNIPEETTDFRVIHNGITYEKTGVDVTTGDPLVVNTVNLRIHLKKDGEEDIGLEGGLVSYFGNGWTSLGSTDANGDVFVEILPGTTSIKMEWEGRTVEKTDIEVDPENTLVEFQTSLQKMR